MLASVQITRPPPIPTDSPVSLFCENLSSALSGCSNTDASRGIDSLPNELLLLIFQFGSTFGSSGTPNDKPFEIVVSQVSNRWRELAITYPPLWTTFTSWHVFDHTDTKVELYARRSKAFPISISVDLSPTTRVNPINRTLHERLSSGLQLMLTLLSPTVHRWVSLTFIVYCPSFMDKILAHLNQHCSAPALEWLSLSIRRPNLRILPRIHPGTLKYEPFHFDLPQLHHLTLENVCLNWAWRRFPHLSSLELMGQTKLGASVPLAHVLSAETCAALTHLVLTDCLAPAFWPPGTLTLPHLRHLTLADLAYAAARPLLARLSIPSLATLHLRAHDALGARRFFAPDEAATALSGPLRAPLRRLEALFLDHWLTPSDAPNARALLRALPALRVLALNFAGAQDLLAMLAGEGTGSGSEDGDAVRPLVPQLRVLAARPLGADAALAIVRHRAALRLHVTKLVVHDEAAAQWPREARETLEELAFVEVAPGAAMSPYWALDLEAYWMQSYELENYERRGARMQMPTIDFGAGSGRVDVAGPDCEGALLPPARN